MLSIYAHETYSQSAVYHALNVLVSVFWLPDPDLDMDLKYLNLGDFPIVFLWCHLGFEAKCFGTKDKVHSQTSMPHAIFDVCPSFLSFKNKKNWGKICKDNDLFGKSSEIYVSVNFVWSHRFLFTFCIHSIPKFYSKYTDIIRRVF